MGIELTPLEGHVLHSFICPLTRMCMHCLQQNELCIMLLYRPHLHIAGQQQLLEFTVVKWRCSHSA